MPGESVGESVFRESNKYGVGNSCRKGMLACLQLVCLVSPGGKGQGGGICIIYFESTPSICFLYNKLLHDYTCGLSTSTGGLTCLHDLFIELAYRLFL